MFSNTDRLTFKQLDAIGDDSRLLHAAQSILLLPLNWQATDEEPVYSVSTESVAKIFTQKGIAWEMFSPLTVNTKLKDERAMDWVAPTLFVSSLLLSQNTMAVSLALNVMASYAVDIFKGIKGDPAVKLTVVQTRQRDKSTREVHYEGPASGLPGLVEVLSAFEPKD